VITSTPSGSPCNTSSPIDWTCPSVASTSPSQIYHSYRGLCSILNKNLFTIHLPSQCFIPQFQDTSNSLAWHTIPFTIFSTYFLPLSYAHFTFQLHLTTCLFPYHSHLPAFMPLYMFSPTQTILPLFLTELTLFPNKLSMNTGSKSPKIP
jgi:hypothetical protein